MILVIVWVFAPNHSQKSQLASVPFVHYDSPQRNRGRAALSTSRSISVFGSYGPVRFFQRNLLHKTILKSNLYPGYLYIVVDNIPKFTTILKSVSIKPWKSAFISIGQEVANKNQI